MAGPAALIQGRFHSSLLFLRGFQLLPPHCEPVFPLFQNRTSRCFNPIFDLRLLELQLFFFLLASLFELVRAFALSRIVSGTARNPLPPYIPPPLTPSPTLF